MFFSVNGHPLTQAWDDNELTTIVIVDATTDESIRLRNEQVILQALSLPTCEKRLHKTHFQLLHGGHQDAHK